ncbi:methyl-accepting chemotaxis protein [Amnimonas aquatica]|uniref:Chemotaxis protein n=1 Tax=Amnimonas aquatica TaxID=2094561 RepID=A0A2P6AUJ2_9GAMM|nr:methyl-accepting chemotaxis protein [Amnimonas aquatica]PQA49513.1 chemotaxis protein [Amnimonas aquatica]
MRTNLPVTGNERFLEEGEFILSKADLKGNITYINRTFIEMSGFTEAELAGQPHNILRHPDMPPEAFRDFWSTLKAGKSWSGLVKNRCKNGDHYWVQANASPIWQNGTMIGYMSVRTRPERKLVEQTEELYRKMRNGESRVTLSEGRVMQAGWRGRLQRFTNISLKHRMMATFAVVAGFWLALTAVALQGAGGGARDLLLSLSAIGALASAGMLWRTYGVLARPIDRIRRQMVEIANGNMSLLVSKDRSDEIGDMSDAFKSMFIKLRFDMADTRRTADAAQRMGFALDNVSTVVTVSNEENNLIYMNHAGRRLFEGIFKGAAAVDRLFGHPIMASLEDPALVEITSGRLDKPRSAEGRVGDRIIRLSTNPVIDARGVYLGRVCQWTDRTVEINAEREVAGMVEAAAAGDFSRRIDESNKEGYFRTLAGDLNRLAEASDNSLSDIVRVLNALAQGDLTQTIERDYQGTFAQLKHDANATVAQLKSIITTITEATDAINSAAKEIAAGNADLSRRTESQAASLEETASSTEELTNTVRNNADNATQASHLARTSSEVADRGGKVVSEVVSTMGAIAESSSKIAEIISVIDGIAFQTNILALNAAVEAARAGEQGRGFAVVAGEVRNLAQRSASAAKEIKELISESVTKVSSGYKLVETAGQTMQEIVSSTQQVASIMTEISQASEEQRNGILQLNNAIGSMDETTQQNAALVEEAAAAAQSLEDQAMNLTQAVGVFRISERGERQAGLGARNVERLPVRAVRPVKAKSSSAAAKLDDEWEEF